MLVKEGKGYILTVVDSTLQKCKRSPKLDAAIETTCRGRQTKGLNLQDHKK